MLELLTRRGMTLLENMESVTGPPLYVLVTRGYGMECMVCYEWNGWMTCDGLVGRAVMDG